MSSYIGHPHADGGIGIQQNEFRNDVICVSYKDALAKHQTLTTVSTVLTVSSVSIGLERNLLSMGNNN